MTIIIKDILIEPKYLNSNLNENIVKKIIEQTNNECSQTYGYILSFNKIIRIITNYITPANSDIIFRVEFDANTLLPKIGDILKGEVFMVFEKGIFISVEQKLKALIPYDNLTDYIFTTLSNKDKDDEPCFINKKNKHCIKNKDMIYFEITCIKYSDKSFSCIGKLYVN